VATSDIDAEGIVERPYALLVAKKRKKVLPASGTRAGAGRFPPRQKSVLRGA